MQFEWDARKARENQRKHGVSFDEATTIFADPAFVDFYDPDHSDSEHRFIVMGESSHGRLLIVAYAERG